MAALLAFLLLLGDPEAGRQPRSAPERHVVLDNPTVKITRLRFAPGAREPIRTENEPLLLVQVTPGVVELAVADARSGGERPAGTVAFVPPNTEHSAANTGKESFEMLVIVLKPTRPAAPAAPATPAPPGIARTMLLDNADVRVVRVEFSPGSREPVHTHPNDLVTVQLTAARVTIELGEKRTPGARPVGDVQFLPRDVQHSYISGDSGSFELLSISIK